MNTLIIWEFASHLQLLSLIVCGPIPPSISLNKLYPAIWIVLVQFFIRMSLPFFSGVIVENYKDFQPSIKIFFVFALKYQGRHFLDKHIHFQIILETIPYTVQVIFIYVCSLRWSNFNPLEKNVIELRNKGKVNIEPTKINQRLWSTREFQFH